jgi:putative endopeptidase
VIGHEITHAFDDQGSQYNKEGNLKNWWTQEDRTKFEERTKVLVDHYNQFVAIDTFHVNGKLTLGENIADLGGLTVAYYAFKKSQKNKTSEKIDGFTPEQRFFLGWAQGWCAKYRDEFLKLALSDVHAPGKARVNVLLSNMPEFYDAFGVKPGDKMYRDEKNRAKIW